jgi:uncharacterized membrane protein
VVGLLVVLALGIWNGARDSIWVDEAFTMTTTAAGPVGAFHQALEVERQGPLYFVLASLWRGISPSLAFTRLFSTLCILLSLFVLDRLGTRLNIGGKRWNLALLAGLTPQFLWAASEARSYALLILFLSFALYASAALWLTDRPASLGAGLGYVTASALAVLTFYYAAFVIAGQALVNLLRRERRAFWVWPVLTLLLLPWAPVALRQHSNEVAAERDADNRGAPRPIAEDNTLRTVPSAVAGSIFRSTPSLTTGAGLLVLTALLAVLLAARARSVTRFTPEEFHYIVIAGFVMLMLLLLRFREADLAQARHWSAATPVLLTLLALIASRLDGRDRALTGAGLAATFVVATVGYQAHHSKEDWRGVAGWITERARPGEPIVFYGSNGSLPFAYYYRGNNPSMTLEAAAPADSILAGFRRSGALWLIERARRPDIGDDEIGRRFGRPLENDTTRIFTGIRVSRLRARRER